MSKQARDSSRQERAAAILAEEQRRRHRNRISIGVVALVVVVLLGMVFVKVLTGPATSAQQRASSGVIREVSSVPASTFDAVGVGAMSTPPVKITGGTPLSDSGKPKVLYVGAEYCPYCAAERWAVVAALSRFGTFTGLGQTHSTLSDVFPGTNTLSFHGASYSSKYLAFNGYEIQDVQGQALDKLPASDEAIFKKYDAPPYVSGGSGSIPFIYYGGKVLSSGASYDPGVLKGLTHAQIAAALKNPSSPVAKAVDGSANAVAAAVCQMNGGKPAAVCGSSGVKAAAAALKTAG